MTQSMKIFVVHHPKRLSLNSHQSGGSLNSLSNFNSYIDPGMAGNVMAAIKEENSKVQYVLLDIGHKVHSISIHGVNIHSRINIFIRMASYWFAIFFHPLIKVFIRMASYWLAIFLVFFVHKK